MASQEAERGVIQLRKTLNGLFLEGEFKDSQYDLSTGKTGDSSFYVYKKGLLGRRKIGISEPSMFGELVEWGFNPLEFQWDPKRSSCKDADDISMTMIHRNDRFNNIVYVLKHRLITHGTTDWRNLDISVERLNSRTLELLKSGKPPVPNPRLEGNITELRVK